MPIRAVLALAALLALPAQAETVTGPAAVKDGDTLEVGGDTVRLFGIDAPELGQTCTRADGAVWPCGRWSRNAVRDRLAGLTLVCEGADRDRYGRLLATCTAGGRDIAADLVRAGIVYAYARYSTRYADAEKAAALEGLGLWTGALERPEAFRAAQAQGAAAAASPAPGGCAIKGNISARGARIYHLPGSRTYPDTVISVRKGERWFCTEAEARAAGWRAARD